MLTLFNRAELLVTCDMIRLARVREALAAADIDYICRAKALSGRGGHTSSFGVGPGARVEYKVYVKRTDLERAKTVL